jgi:signal transduction histidine kinase/ABC-type xylose transport system substrate-binding protein
MAKVSDSRKTKAQLIEELQRLRQQVAESQESDKEHEQVEGQLQKSYKNRDRQVRLTEFANQIVACTDLDDLYRRVVTLLHQFGYYHVQLLRHDPAAEALALVADHSEIRTQLLTQGYQVPMGEGLVGKAAVTGISILRSDISKDPDWQATPFLPDARGDLAVPIKLSAEDADAQLKGLRYFINGGFDGFAVLPMEPAIIAPVAKEALDKGMSVIVYSTELGEENQTALIYADNYELGYLLGVQAGEWARKHVPAGETLKVGVLNYRLIPQVIRREEGIIEGIKEVFGEGVEIVGSETAYEPTQALPITVRWLKAYPDLRMVVGINDAGALGAYQAVIAAGKNDAEAFFVGGIDATDEALAAIKEGGAYQATVDQKPREMGIRVIRILVAAIAGQPYQPVSTVECTPVNPDNIDEFPASGGAKAVVETGEGESVLADMDLGHIKIGLSVLTLANPYFVAVVEGARGEAERLGVELVVSDSRPVWGVLDVQSNVAGSLDAEDQLILEGLCGLTAVVIESHRVEAERRRLLTALERRALQLQTAAEVSRAASSILDPDELIQQVVNLVRERFDLHYAGLFLVDDSGKWAVLRAGTGEAGRKMVEQGHKLEVGGQSMIGWCMANKQARITLDVTSASSVESGEEAVRFANPLLPETRSDLALPLISRRQVIGALTIQSTQEAAFGEEDVAVLQTMANQLANAIANARLYDQAQQEITERKWAEEQLQQYATKLEQANEEIKQFAYIVSHDLRAPLTNLKGFSEELSYALEVIGSAMDKVLPHLEEKQRLAVTTALQEDVPEALSFIGSSVTRMDDFINAVLKLSRLGRRELKFEPVDMDALVQATLQTLGHQIEERQVKVNVGPLPEVVADRASMEQIMGNILGNAVKYLDLGRSGEIEVTAERGRDETTFRVWDNGRGIAEEDMDKVFAPFRRAGKQDVPGEGMGLPYVQTLVRRHGGRIWCESQPGKGSAFYFTVPANVKSDS